jgi:putative copper resistance protein D
MKGMTTEMRPPGSLSPVADLHAGGAVMWIGGDAIMLGFMMLVFLMWAHADRVGTASRGWLETVRTASFETLVAPPGSPRGASAQQSAPELAQDLEPAPEPAAAAGPPAAEPAVAGARGTIDDDEHLDAYNAYLARLNRPGHRPGR